MQYVLSQQEMNELMLEKEHQNIRNCLLDELNIEKDRVSSLHAALEAKELSLIQKAEDAFYNAMSALPVETDINAIKEAKEKFYQSLNS